MRLLPTIAGLVIALGAAEGIAYWWMHPAPAGQGEPVLVYHPSRSAGVSPVAQKQGASDQETGVGDQEGATAQSASSNQPSKITNLSVVASPKSDHQSEISSSATFTPLPEVVSRALPSLRCTTGTAARIDRDDGVTIHVAFFEWDLSSSTNVLEAFKHLPDECMGSIGMTLIEKAPVRTFVVRGQGADVRAREEAAARGPSSAQKSAINNLSVVASAKSDQQSSISPSSPNPESPISNHSLSFDHTVFRDPGGVVVHAFKGTWVSGASNLLGAGIRGGGDQSRQLRWNSALKSFRPAHARVAQGAVRGIANPDLAWETFEDTMLKDLSFAVLER